MLPYDRVEVIEEHQHKHKHEHEQESARASSSASLITHWTHNHKAPPHAPTRHHYALVHHYRSAHARQGVQVGAESSVEWVLASARVFASALLGLACVRRTNVPYYAHVQRNAAPSHEDSLRGQPWRNTRRTGCQ